MAVKCGYVTEDAVAGHDKAERSPKLNGVAVTSSPSPMLEVLFSYIPVLNQQPLIFLT